MRVRALITIVDGKPPMAVDDEVQLDEAIRRAADEARVRGKLGAIVIEASNKDSVTIVVGNSETVLSFDSADRNPPYYASKGVSNEDEPVMTCYLNFAHHTEFPRRYVIPLKDGIAAIKQFVRSGELPTCIAWQEV
jgi:hypothetical protein